MADKLDQQCVRGRNAFAFMKCLERLVSMFDFKVLGQYINILILSIFITISYSGVSNALAMFYEVSDTITKSDMGKFRYIIGSLGNDIERSVIKLSKNQYFSVLRIEKKQFCIQSSCLTYVISNCSRRHCPYASAIVGKEFMIPDEPSVVLPGSYSIEFYSEPQSGTRFVITDKFITTFRVK